MAKKVNKKETEKVVETVVETVEMESTEIKANISEIEETINNIDTEIKADIVDIEQLQKESETVLKPLAEINDKMSELDINAEKINEKLTSSSKEEIEEFIQEEIKKVENVKKDLEKITKKNNVKPSNSMTNWWNGMGYDI